ncbi:hypothetical protein P3L10_028194 [Capsicum annuum]|uniref:uncharacterized protein LOC124887803 n=1 Tax=Capsicum annuum TaxID=4072 RepID=UPI001FB09BE5|nr:uncharacterized protein LOC124887803 [Capsicum annuum]
MKKLRQKLAKKDKKKESGSKKRGHNSPESKTPVKRRIVVEEICRDELPKELSYVIKEISSHPLRFVSLCNLRFKDEIKEVVGQEVLHLFEKTIFGYYLNISISNYIRQITKCILMLEIEQSNQEETHVFVKGQILRFSINEFALIIGLNCFGNVDDFKYEDFSLSRLMKRYFLQSINGVDKEALVEHFLKENFENKEDALQMAIRYFIHTFIYSQLNASPVPFFDLKMVEDGKYQFFPWVAVKEGNNIPCILNWSVVAVRPQFNQFMTVMFSKYSYANIFSTADEFEKLDLVCTNFASEQHSTSSVPSSSKNQDQRRYKANLPQVTEDHDSFDDFSSTLPQFFMRKSIHVSRTVSEPMTMTEKDVPTGRRSNRKKQTQLRDTKKQTTVKQEDMEEKSKVDADSTSTLNRKDLVVKADLHSLEFEMKAYMKAYSRQECDPSDDVVDDAGPTSTDSAVKETDKSIEMEDDKANQAPLLLKKVEQHEKDVGIEKQSDIVVEEIQPLESIISGQEHDLALMIYKPPPTTSAEYEISDTTILSAFSTPQKNMSANKNVPSPRSRKPSKIYRSPFLTHFRSSSKEKKKLIFKEQKKYPFEGYHITGDSPTVEMKIFEEWIHDGLYEKHMKKKDNDDHYKVNCSTLEFRQLDFVVVFPKSKN